MPRKRKIVNVTEKCRVCLAEHGSMRDIFDSALQPMFRDLTECTSIDITEDEDLPRNLCHVCLYKLEMWSEFKEQFVRSHNMLLTHLGIPEPTDITARRIKAKRKHTDTQLSGEESLPDLTEAKKVRPDIPPLIPLEFASVDCVADQTLLKEMYIPEDDPITVSSKESPQQTQGISAANQHEAQKTDKDEAELELKEEHPQIKPTLVPMKVKYFSGRRGKTTERRRASTKRWVARKKALLAAIGEQASDTDSIGSDNETQLSPVQKARAKTNADKEAEKQRRLAKALKNLETNMKGQYGIKHDSDGIVLVDTDSDARRHRTRSQKTINAEIAQKNESRKWRATSKQGSKPSEEKLKTPAANADKHKSNLKELVKNEEPSAKFVSPDLSVKVEDREELSRIDPDFNPQSVRSEIEMGEAVYIVTSTLVLSEPQYLNKTNLKNSSMDDNTQNVGELAITQNRNTDIIDAVQLRRVNPVLHSDTEDKKYVERCLNIEVEGTELDALQRVQAELANFVETDMKTKLLTGSTVSTETKKSDEAPKDSFRTLDEQLKTIVENAIKSNIETSKTKRVPMRRTTPRCQKTRTFSPAFIKAAGRSKVFQPKVLLMRLDPSKVQRRYKINNVDVLNKRELENGDLQRQQPASRKRQSVRPARYCDYKDSPVSEDSAVSEDRLSTLTPKMNKPGPGSKSKARKSAGPPGLRPLTFPQQVLHAIRSGLSDKKQNNPQGDQSSCQTVECDTTTKLLPLESSARTPMPVKAHSQGPSKKQDQNRRPKAGATVKNFMCKICKQIFDNPNLMEKHIKTHMAAPEDTTSLKHDKHRMMRCKRCHEIVEARFVKVHICRSTTATYKCYVCNSTFRTEKMLVRHLESHEESEFNIESIERSTNAKKLTDVTSTQNSTNPSLADANIGETKTMMSVAPKETYTCFVCDKKFTDDQILKDHLQKHCDDVSEDEASNDKELFQCAICGDTLDTEEILESHVEKHLFDDEDDNPNLISIGNENDKVKVEKEDFNCPQCTDKFDSEMLLAMHMQAHEEEAAIAEWERKGMKADEEFICVICDEVFESEEDLSEHLDVHNGNAHVCLLCDRPFPTLEDLQKHVNTH